MKKPRAPGLLPKRARVGNDVKGVEIDPETYFLGVRMEKANRLRRGQALMLAATLKEPHNGVRTSKPSKGR